MRFIVFPTLYCGQIEAAYYATLSYFQDDSAQKDGYTKCIQYLHYMKHVIL